MRGGNRQSAVGNLLLRVICFVGTSTLPHEAPLHTCARIEGAIVTAGNLIFVAASRDGHLRAFDKHTGAELWKYLLPAGGQATPMTYELDGKQYVVIAAGGHGKFSTKMGDYVVAFALK